MVYAMDDFPGALSALMSEQGISASELGRRVPCDRSLICRLRSGKHGPSEKMARRIDEVLGAGGELLALGRPQPTRRAVIARGLLAAGLASAGPPLFGTVDLDEQDRLAWAQARPQRADPAAAQSLGAVLAGQRGAEDAFGAAAVIGPVMAQLGGISEMVTGSRGRAHDALVDVAQQWAQFAGWLHVARRDFDGARVLFGQTLELAAEADDPTMTATVLRLRGYMAWLAGEPGPMIGLARAAQRDRRLAVSQRALAACVEARGHALTGDAHAAERKLGEIEELAARLAADPSQQRPWSYWATPQWFACDRGMTLGYLAHIPRYRDQALAALTAGYEALDPDLRQSEWAADYLVHRAAVHVRGGDQAEACADAMRVVPVWRRTDSASLGGMLAQLHAAMAARWPGDPHVGELAEAIR